MPLVDDSAFNKTGVLQIEGQHLNVGVLFTLFSSENNGLDHLKLDFRNC